MIFSLSSSVAHLDMSNPQQTSAVATTRAENTTAVNNTTDILPDVNLMLSQQNNANTGVVGQGQQ